jgi:hypothetical protein
MSEPLFTAVERDALASAGFTTDEIDVVEAAVLPACAKRVRVEALLEAADRLSYTAAPTWVVDDLLRWAARADAEEMPESVFPATPGAANVALDAEEGK